LAIKKDEEKKEIGLMELQIPIRQTPVVKDDIMWKPPKEEKDMTNDDRFMYLCHLNALVRLNRMKAIQFQNIIDQYPWLTQTLTKETPQDAQEYQPQEEVVQCTKQDWEAAGFSLDEVSLLPVGWD